MRVRREAVEDSDRGGGEMNHEKWNRSAHWDLVEGWARARGLAGLGAADQYPQHGWVVDDCVAGFLFRTDARALAWFGSVIADPGVEKSRRHAAIRELVRLAKETAEKQGIRSLVSFPRSTLSLVSLFGEEGFSAASAAHVYMRCELGKEP